MPLYEYRCSACAARFEILQRMGEGPEALACPACGGRGVERQLSTFAAASGGSRASEAEASGCGRPACAGGACAGGADWN